MLLQSECSDSVRTKESRALADKGVALPQSERSDRAETTFEYNSPMRAVITTAALLVVVVAAAVAGRLLLPDLSTWGSAFLPIATPTPCETTYETIVGRYYRDDRRQFLEFRPDGTVFMSVGGGTASYAVDRTSVVVSAAIAGSARGSILWNGSAGIGTRCAYTGVIFQRIFFESGGSTIQQALAGGWDKVGPPQ